MVGYNYPKYFNHSKVYFKTCSCYNTGDKLIIDFCISNNLEADK